MLASYDPLIPRESFASTLLMLPLNYDGDVLMTEKMIAFDCFTIPETNN